MEKILLPTDFSDNANNALTYAIVLANHFGSEITLLHSYRVYSTTGMFISVESYLQEEAAEQMLKLLRKTERELRGKARIETIVIRGEAISVISEIANKEKFDLVIMGTQGASGLKEVFLGSVTHGVLRQINVPLLAIPSQYSFKPISRAVLAIDQQGISFIKVILPLVKFIKAFQAKLAVYHKDTGDLDKGIDPSVEIFLEGVEYSLHYELDPDNINDSINQFVKDYKAELLCMIRRKLGFLEQIFHSSVTSKEVFNSPVPLLILHDVG